MRTRIFIGLLCSFWFGSLPLTAQCALSWLPGDALAGVADEFGAAATIEELMIWDRDGAGPAPPLLLMGGDFALAGTEVAGNIVTFDPNTGVWQALGAGVDGVVKCVVALPNGDLLVGGAFGEAGGVPAAGLARWDGVTWSQFGGGVVGEVRALAVLPSGDVVAGGYFTSIGGYSVDTLARWDGVSWSALGGGFLPWGADVRTLAMMPNGDLVAGGNFDSVGGIAARGIARWNGANWQALGTGLGISATVNTTLVMPNGDLVAGGRLFNGSLGGPALSGVAAWDGNQWDPLGGGVTSSGVATVYDLTPHPQGGFVAVGTFSVAGTSAAPRSAHWDGASWSALGNGIGNAGPVYAAATMPNGEIVAGSRPDRWDGMAWQRLTTVGFETVIDSLLVKRDGVIVVGGTWTQIGGVDNDRIATWVGGQWGRLGFGFDNGQVSVLAEMPNGDIVAGGSFTASGGVAVSNIARWNGVGWQPLGAGTGGAVNALAVADNGDVYAGGSFATAGGQTVNSVARWDGATWHPVGTGVLFGTSTATVWALQVLANQDLVVGGNFQSAGGIAAIDVARWDGANWHSFGSTGLAGSSEVYALAQLPDGDLVIGGSFTAAGTTPLARIARWDGIAWQDVGGGVSQTVFDFEVLPDGSLLAAGGFASAGGAPASRLARWDGSSWQALVGGTDGLATNVEFSAGGELVVTGNFARAGGAFSAKVARLQTSCTPAVTVVATGCASSGGANELDAEPAWTGGAWTSNATGLPLIAPVAVGYGFSATSLSLATVFPQAGPGCVLAAAPDVVAIAATTNGSLTAGFLIPNVSSLAGTVFYHQLVPFDFDPAGNLVEVSATNALALTIGTF